MSDDFRPVTRKKWLAKRNLQPRQRRISDKCYNPDCVPIDIEKFLVRLEKTCEHMVQTDYFTQSLTTLKDSLLALGIADTTHFKRLVCFGIGPFTRSFQAFHQLAFILKLQNKCNITEALYFDPVFQESEKQVLENLKCVVMSKNCEAKYKADELTLFYMPHCPNALTNNLLWCNWRPENLKNLVLINNSFDSLCSSKPERILKLDSNYLLSILLYTKEFSLEDDYEPKNVFNDLSVHVFPFDDLPENSSNFWVQEVAPVYNDAEMISAEVEFSNLSLS